MKNKLLFLIPILILIDQVTKHLSQKVTLPLITYTKNTGIAFSLLKNNNLLLTIITSLILLILIYYYIKEPKHRLGLVFIIAGGTGNLIDRLIHNHVIDFINIRIWPIFNLADLFNIIGIIIIICQISKPFKQKNPKLKQWTK